MFELGHSFEGREHKIYLYDILGVDEFNNKIDQLIRECNAFALVFSLTKPSSFTRLEVIKNRIYSIKDNVADFRNIPIIVLGELNRQQGRPGAGARGGRGADPRVHC